MKEKILKLSMLLSGPRIYNVEEISEPFEIAEPTAYRHLCTIENAGFVLERCNGRYRLELDNKQGCALEKSPQFSEEKVSMLHQALDALK